MIGKKIKIPLTPADNEAFAKALAERKKWMETERLVELVGAERRAKEDLIERNRKATARAKDAMLRSQHTADEFARKVMRKARGILGTKYPWED
jgi:hypothetical protein